MKFVLSPEQDLLAQTAARFCAAHTPPVADVEAGRLVDRKMWRSAADIGFFSLRGDDPDLGSRSGAVDAALVAQEVGRALLPGPLTATMVAAEVIPEARGGDLVVAAVRRTRRGGALVEHPASADALLIYDNHAVRLVDSADVVWKPVEAVDPLTPIGIIEDLPVGTLLVDGHLAAGLSRFGRILDAAEQAGLAGRSVEQAVHYAQDREQFGRALASFQALKHILADMAVDAELAQAAALYAAGMLDIGAEWDGERSALAAALTAEEAARKNAERAIQVWGAMGYTWETGLHLTLRRSWAISARSGPLDLPAALAGMLMAAPDDAHQRAGTAAGANGSGAGVETIRTTQKGM